MTTLLCFLIFFLLCILCLVEIKQQYKIGFFIVVLLILFAGFRGSVDNDYDTYEMMYNKISNNINVNIEPTFYFITDFVNYLQSNISLLILIYSIIGVSLKTIALSRLSEFWLYSILVYFSFFFILHEMTQIRVGIASAFILFSIQPLKKNQLLHFFALITLGTLFHYSTLLILPVLFLNKNSISKGFYVLIPFGFLIHFSSINPLYILEYLPIESFSLKFNTYKYLSTNQSINPFGVWNILRCVFCLILLYNWKYLQSKNEYSVILIKFYILSVFCLLSFSKIPTFASRISDLYAIVEVILIPFIFYLLKDSKTKYAVIMIFLTSFTMLLLSIFHINLIH
jgi:hypothetical protein